VLRRIADRVARWDGPDGDPDLAADYAGRCATLGRTIRVELPGREITGVAQGLDADARLRVLTAQGVQVVGAGDVVHLR